MQIEISQRILNHCDTSCEGCGRQQSNNLIARVWILEIRAATGGMEENSNLLHSQDRRAFGLRELQRDLYFEFHIQSDVPDHLSSPVTYNE